MSCSFFTCCSYYDNPPRKERMSIKKSLNSFMDIPTGRGDRIRTCGLLLPKQARYQTAPRLDI